MDNAIRFLVIGGCLFLFLILPLAEISSFSPLGLTCGASKADHSNVADGEPISGLSFKCVALAKQHQSRKHTGQKSKIRQYPGLQTYMTYGSLFEKTAVFVEYL